MAHPDSIAARKQKTATAHELGINEARIRELVETFYEEIRADELLGPIFDSRITQWPKHLDRMVDFWVSIAIESGRFHGNPMIKHIAIPQIEKPHFDQWLVLFERTIVKIIPNREAQSFLSERAHRIADSLMTGIFIHRDGLPKPQNTKEPKHVAK